MMMRGRKSSRRRIQVFCIVVQSTGLFISQSVLPLFSRIRSVATQHNSSEDLHPHSLHLLCCYLMLSFYSLKPTCGMFVLV